MFLKDKHHYDQDGKILVENMMTPNMWFSSTFEKDNLMYYSDVLKYISDEEKFNQLSSEEKKRIYYNILSNADNHRGKFNEMKSNQANIEHLKKIKSFIQNNFNFEKANAQFLECQRIIFQSRRVINTNFKEKNDNFIQSMKITNAYYRKYNYPFNWVSSSTLHHKFYPLIIKITNIREHCIMLAWRVVFICLIKIFKTIDFCDNIAIILKNSHKLITMAVTNKKKYEKIKPFLIYSMVIMNQVIPCEMRQLAGSLSNFANTSGALVIPELNPHVASTFALFLNDLSQMCFLNISMSYYFSRQYETNPDMTVINDYLNITDVNSDRTSEEDYQDMNQHKINSSSVDFLIDLCFEDPKVMDLVSMIFRMSYAVLEQIHRYVWNYQLNSPFFDLFNQNIDEVYPSEASRDLRNFIVENFFSEDRKEGVILELYQKTVFAMNLKNFLVGQCIYMECIMNCYEIAKIEIADDGDHVIQMLVNLARKAEMLLLPIFDRTESAIELMCWIIKNIKVRKMMSERIEHLFFDDRNERVASCFISGKTQSYMWLFLVKDMEEDEVDHMTFFDRMQASSEKMVAGLKSLIITPQSYGGASSSSDQERGGGSYKTQKILFQDDEKKKKKMGFDVDVAKKSHFVKKKMCRNRLILPFDYDDIYTWSTMIGYYSFINSEKSKVFNGKIELYSFVSFKANFLMPKEDFLDFYNDNFLKKMIMNANK